MVHSLETSEKTIVKLQYQYVFSISYTKNQSALIKNSWKMLFKNAKPSTGPALA